jgi:hypothetical protein
MDGACNAAITYYGICTKDNVYQCPQVGGPCPQYSYVPNTNGVLDPYFNIAELYGFANWMFQTNQGPSFPAHQFLLSGTSAPAAYSQSDDFYKWFAAENAIWTGHPHQGGSHTGCTGPVGVYVKTIDPSGSEGDVCPTNGGRYCAYPCYNHPTLATDVLDQNNIGWAYYGAGEAGLWTAPNAFQNTCGSPHSESCNLDEWQTHVQPYFPIKSGPDKEYAPILRDIENCSLAAVNWVVPLGHWSDHPGYDPIETPGPHDGGPSFVAHIVNKVGESQCASPAVNWSNTVILITWDDWGGFYDHVSPDWPSGPGIGYAHDRFKSGWYVNGFRVPMLVVSAFNKHVTGSGGFDGYVSGPRDNHTCEGTNYCHDFGSILNFVEFTFGSGGQPLGTMWDQHSDYADHFAPDAPPTCSSCDYSLSDFFNFNQNPTAFTAITGMKYAETCFHNPDQTGCWPGVPDADPDDDADEN